MKYEVLVSSYSSMSKELISDLGLHVDDNGDTVWPCEYDYIPAFVEINSLEELHEFIGKYGRVVLTESTIEIYNGYRE